jgi:hypothetical protein
MFSGKLKPIVFLNAIKSSEKSSEISWLSEKNFRNLNIDFFRKLIFFYLMDFLKKISKELFFNVNQFFYDENRVT